MDAVVTIRNAHVPACGLPPRVENGENRYIGYFENVHGEQWVFTFDRLTGRGTLCGGDIGWENPVEVIEGQTEDLILSIAESLWLTACWTAATGSELSPGSLRPDD